MPENGGIGLGSLPAWLAEALGPSFGSRMMDQYRMQRARFERGERGPAPPGSPEAAAGLDVAGAFDFTGPIGLGMAGMIKAYHAADAPFNKFDFSKVGRFTKQNATDTNPNSWPMRLARLGAWFSDKDLSGPMGSGALMRAELADPTREFSSLDELADFIEDAGGAMKARKALRDEGHQTIAVTDEEFGGTSYVALHPRGIGALKRER